MQKFVRLFLIFMIGTSILWMGSHFRPGPEEVAAKVFDGLFSYIKEMPNYMFRQDKDDKPRKVRVNGNQTYLSVQLSDDDVDQVLDFYARQYEPLSLDRKVFEAAEHIDAGAVPSKDQVVQAFKVLECLKDDQHYRYQGDGFGFLGTFEFKNKNASMASCDFLKTWTSAMKSGKIGEIGTFRVTMAIKQGKHGGTRILNLWTDDDLNLKNLFPKSLGKDMPGEDIENVPRFSGAIRTLSVAQENKQTLDRLVVYEAEGSVVSHILYYHSRMSTEGWQTDPFFDKTAKEQRQKNVMFYKKVGRECTISIDEDPDTGKIISTIMDRKKTNG